MKINDDIYIYMLQKLKAAMHYTTMKICQETEEKYNLPISQQVVAAIAETVWRQTESFAVDLELFARSAQVHISIFASGSVPVSLKVY